jgi:predicted  nucleic acid-binding Zn-ribbon protein
MKHIVESLLRAQPVLLRENWDGAEQQAVLRRLRNKIPEPILAHYLRSLENDRNGVSLVSHGVCGECHLRIPSATVASLAENKDVHLCENCGCYLLLSPEEVSAFAQFAGPAPSVACRRRGRPAAVAV